MLTLDAALLSAHPCPCACHSTLDLRERAEAVSALYLLDDALRGWGYQPLYDVHGATLWREAQERGDAAYRGVAVRFGECVYRRLLGSLLHECVHAALGDVTKANYGIPFGLPYGVPEELPAPEEEAFLAAHHWAEARAFVGAGIVSRALFGADWDAPAPHDVGTYAFPGGHAIDGRSSPRRAIARVPKGYRPVPHLDPTLHPEPYHARARKLEGEARLWFDAPHLNAVLTAIRGAASRARPSRRPPAAEVARLAPHKIGRNDPCPCGSGKKVKQCCGDAAGTTPPVAPAR